MTAPPNDTEALLDELRRNAQAPMDRFDRLNGMGGLPEYGDDERPFPDEVLKLLDLLAAAEHRATRAEAQSAVRGRAVVIYRERAREAEARIEAWEKQYDHDLAQADLIADQAEARVRHLERAARVLVREVIAAEDARDEHRRGKAAVEARIRDLTQEAKDERGAALDQMEQVKIREARIEAVEDVLDRKLPPSARTLAAEVRRALDG